MVTRLISILLTVFLLTGCGESIDAAREVYRSKNCVYNGEGGYYCIVNLGRFYYCYEVDGPHSISLDMDICREAFKGVR